MPPSILLLTAPLLAGTARAATWGNPARTPDVGLVELRLALNNASRGVDVGTCTGDGCVAQDCTTELCTTVARNSGAGLRLALRPLPFLGLWGEVGLASDAVDGTDHAALARDLAGGLHLSLPLRAVRPALSVAAEWIEGSGTDDAGALVSAGHALAVDVAATVALGDTRYGAATWLGPVARVYEDRSVALVADDLELALDSSWPVGAVLGGEVVSRPLGLPWRSRSPRLSAGMEVRGLDQWGLSGWVGVVY